MSDDEIDKAVKEAEQFAEEDKKKKEVVDTKNNLDQMIAGIEKVMKDSGDKVSEEDKTKLNAELEKAKETYKNSEKAEELKSALENLTQVSNEIFTKLYKNANPNGNADGANGGANTDQTENK